MRERKSKLGWDPSEGTDAVAMEIGKSYNFMQQYSWIKPTSSSSDIHWKGK